MSSSFYQYLIAAFFVFAISLGVSSRAETTIPAVTADSFYHHVITAQKPVLIQFDAAWCPFCRKFAPIIEKFATEYKDEIAVYRIDADKEGDLMIRLGARTLPTTVMFFKGKEVSRKGGFMTAEQLEEWVSKEVSKLTQKSDPSL